MTEVQDYLFVEDHKILDQVVLDDAGSALAMRAAEYPNSTVYVRVADWNQG